MDGILIIDKPAGLTSHDVVAKVRRLLKTKRVGHTGTLDPFATGVLVLLVGRATRLAQFLDKDEKEYEAVIRFGFNTDTGDLSGTPLSAIGGTEDLMVLDESDYEAALSPLVGEIKQVPPMYSAKKIDGKKLYELARQGKEVEREAVRVKVNKFEILPNELGAWLLRNENGTCDLQTRVACSAGTYVRALAESVGENLKTGAHLAELRRTRAGCFDLSQSVTLDELEQRADPTTALLPKEFAVEDLPSIVLNSDRVEKTKSGLSTRTHETTFADSQAVRMLDEKHNLIAVGFYDAAEKSVRPKIVLV